MEFGPISHTLLNLSASIAILTTTAVVLKWLYRKIRNAEIFSAFVKDMAINHLPHIYKELRKQSAALHLEDTDSPPIRFIDLNGAA